MQIPIWVSAFFILRLGIRKQNPSCRGQLGRRQLDGGESFIFAKGENANESLIRTKLGMWTDVHKKLQEM